MGSFAAGEDAFGSGVLAAAFFGFEAVAFLTPARLGLGRGLSRQRRLGCRDTLLLARTRFEALGAQRPLQVHQQGLVVLQGTQLLLKRGHFGADTFLFLGVALKVRSHLSGVLRLEFRGR
ncbi:hypothetical protein ACRJ4W_10780 [Streptomyces sp. GLT-R25]